MKNIVIFGIILLLAGACSEDKEPPTIHNIGGDVIDTRIKIAIVDSALQDRLSPESPSYFGEAYASEIKIMYPYYGRKYTLLNLWFYLTEGGAEFSESLEGVQPPFRETADYGAIDQNSLGYYFLYADPISAIAEDDITYVYIQYPDGSEDEIKVKLYRNEEDTLLFMDKIWINDELAYEMNHYYNTKYYPCLEPVLDDDGNQINGLVRPLHATDVIVITK